MEVNIQRARLQIIVVPLRIDTLCIFVQHLFSEVRSTYEKGLFVCLPPEGTVCCFESETTLKFTIFMERAEITQFFSVCGTMCLHCFDLFSKTWAAKISEQCSP